MSEINEKTKITVPIGGLYAASAALFMMFIGSYFALYARVDRIESNDRLNCVILMNVQNHTVPMDKRIARDCK